VQRVRTQCYSEHKKCSQNQEPAPHDF
jgi:hypothetical protein